MVEEIKALKELLDIGAITQEEYDAKKQELLNAAPYVNTTPQSAIINRAESNPTSQSNEKSKIAASLLAIFLGSLGIHKFYLGYKTAGIIMLLVTLLGSILLFLGPIAMGIISLIEGIIYLTKTDEAFEATYVQGKKEWF